MSLSPARQHRLRVQAEQAAREGGSVRHASGYDLMLLQLAEDRRRLKGVQSTVKKAEIKVELLPKYAAWVMAAAKVSLQRYIASQTRLGRDIRRSAIFAALHVEGVQRVELASPLADVVLNKTQAASCTQWSVTNGGTDE